MNRILMAVLALFGLPFAAAQADSDQERAVQALIPSLEAYTTKYMRAFDVPGTVIGIVANDKLVYSKGFGTRRKNGDPVDSKTLFQIGSTTKAFLAATLAIAVDRGRIHWDDRVVDLDPDFQLKDPWVTREFRVFDLLAQRSGLPPYANDGLALFGLEQSMLIRSLRFIDPVSSFRATFAYTNVTHILAGRILAKLDGLADWNAVLKRDLLDPLGMAESSFTAQAIAAAPNHADGYRYTPERSEPVPFTQLFPYDFYGAGDINSNLDEMSRWVRLQLDDGVFEGKQIVSSENMAVTRIARVGLNDRAAYAMGWVLSETPNGTLTWHNGGTTAFGAFVGLQRDRKLGLIILSNEQNVGFPDALGAWIMDRLLGNPEVDHAAETLTRAKTNYEDAAKLFAPPPNPRPVPSLADLPGEFANPAIGTAELALNAGELTFAFNSTGAQLNLRPWDGDIFIASLIPEGRFADIAANLGPNPNAFVQFQMDNRGKLNLLKLSFDDGQAYEFHRKRNEGSGK
jgi:CubicO group peptidase (beta-lactamase class C family)